MPEERPDTPTLSERELELLRLLATGASNKELADALVISPNTVKVHLRNIYTKLGVSSRTEATLYAIRTGLVRVKRNFQTGELSAEVVAEPVAPPSDPAPEPDAAPDVVEAAPAPTVTTSVSKKWWLPVGIGIVAAVAVSAFAFWQRSNQPDPVNLALDDRWTTLAPVETSDSAALRTYLDGVYLVDADHIQHYEPSTQVWSDLPAAPTDISTATPFGFDGDLIFLTDTVTQLDLASAAWQTTGDLPTALTEYDVVVTEGQGLVFDPQGVFSYQPVTAAWNAVAPLPRATDAVSAASTLANAYVLLNTAQSATTALDVFALGTKQFVSELTLPMPIENGSVVSIIDNLYVVGQVADGSVRLWQYQEGTAAWAEIATPGFSTLPLITASGSRLYLLDPTTANFYTYDAVFTVMVPIIGS